MASYICKCGRVVEKSTTADNTGNRDTAGCEGCPYLLPWGPMEWNGKGFKQDIQGYECRMSPSLEYATYYQGNGTDKCVLHIYSLDYDFLERLSTWVAEQFPEKEISCSFDRSKIRATEFVGGLYGISVYPMQNKRGIAAKAALLHQFFDNNGARLDMTPEEEKAHILAAIEAGKAAYQRKKENMEYIISENLENDCVYAYAAKEFWVYDKQACRWYTSGFCREQYERVKQKLPHLTPEDFLTDSNDYSLLDDYELPSAALDALQEAVKSGKREVALFEGTNPPTPADADASPCAPGASDAPLSPSPSAAADAVSLAAEEAPAFDYSEFDAQTVADLHLAEREYAGGKKMAEMGLRRMADAVAIAHDALCGSCDKMSQLKHGNRGENTFGAWCESIGIHRKAAERLLQVAKLMDGSTPREEKVLEELSPTLLYAAAKPSAPAELVQAVKDGDITTHKQYQEAMAQLKAEREARKKAEHDAQRYREDSEKAREAAHTYHCQYEQANQQRNALLDQQTEYIYRIEAAEKDKAAAQQRAAKAEAQGKKDAALVEKLQDIVLQRDNEVAEQKERADAAEIRARQAENRPVEVAVQAPDPAEVQRLASEKAAEMTAMLKAQLHTLQAQLDDAESRADAAANNAYMSAAEFAAQAAAMIDGIRASFWAMAKELPDADFNQALEPLDTAVSRIYNREWEDGWNDSWENNEEDNEQ